MAAAIAFVLGLVVGSFLNVCIWRLPRHESLLWPPSHCPACGVRLLWRDNIPLLSFLLLRGRCRRCGVRIPWFYPVVECLTALAFSACIDRFGLTAEAAKWIVFCCLLIVLSFTDLQRRLLPDRVNFFGLAAGLLFSLIVELHDDTGGWLFAAIFHHPLPLRLTAVADASLGAIVGGGILWLFAEGYFRLRGREGMGLGDVKMMLMAGTFLGVRRTMLMLLIGSLLGTVAGLFMIWALKRGRDYPLPFGTFLGAAGLLIVFFWEPLQGRTFPGTF
jgi:leader peptidase (prepilin peptidase)/N-methyltransferase